MNTVRQGRRRDFDSALAFAIPFFGMLIVMAFSQYRPFGKYSMLYSDMYHQYYPFFAEFRRTIRSGGSLLYSWSLGMGMDYLGLIAYYLASPLNLFSVLLPDGLVLDYFSLLVPLKLGFAGLFYSGFLKAVFRRRGFSVVLFSSFYALCAWSLGYQWNVMWLDTFALLPLVMMGMLALLKEKRVVLYTVSLFFSVFANYYIGFFTCIFVALVFFCYEFCRFPGWKRFFADLGRIALFSVLALAMTAVIFYPSLAGLQSTQSSVNAFPKGFRLNIAPSNTLLGLVKAMCSVAGNMGGGVSPTFKEGLPNLYCGVGTVLLGMLFLISREVKWKDKVCTVFLLLFFNVSFIIRQLDYIWHGFHFTNMIPYRFSFLYSFVLLYMAYRAWCLRRKFDRWEILAAVLLSGAILCCSDDLLSTVPLVLGTVSLDIPLYLIYNVGFLAAYAGCLLYGAWKPQRGRKRAAQTACQVIAGVEIAALLLNFGMNFTGTLVTNYPKGTEESASMFRYLREREAGKPFSRTEVTHSQTLNDDALNGYNGISAFTSSANVRITEFMKALGYGAKNTYNRYCFEESSPVANLFLNLKYMMDRDGRDKTSTFFEEVHHFGKVTLLKNTAYLPLGFLTEPELAEVDFSDTNAYRMQNTLFRAATGLEGDVWHRITGNYLEVSGVGVNITDQNTSGYCAYSDCDSGANLFYSYTADRDGFACIHLNLPKRNHFYVSVNGTELYGEDISLPQMLAVQDVQAGDVIDIRIVCQEGESGTMTVMAGILDNDLVLEGVSRLNENTLKLTCFRDTYTEGTIDCQRDGLLYTSIPQNGNWKAKVDGVDAEIQLVGDCMIALPLTEGSHRVSFTYENAAFSLGWKISLAGAAVFTLLAVTVYLPRRKEQ